MFEELIKRDIDMINEEAAWSDDQQAVFCALLKGKHTDEGIMHQLCMKNARKYYRIKREIKQKIMRILREEGQ